MDKIPIHMLSESPGDETFHCGTIKDITKKDYAVYEKINQMIDWLRELEEFKSKIEGR